MWFWGSRFIAAAGTAYIAKLKGYNVALWFVLGLLLFPISLIIITVLPNKEKIQSKSFYKDNYFPKNDPYTTCTKCGKEIPISASKCKYCGEKFDIIDS